jgi:hypothetical protein
MSPALRYETAALAALASPRLPTDIRVRGRALSFPGADGLADVAVIVTLTAGDAGHWVDRASDRYRTDFTILAQVLDAAGTVVWKGSQPYALQGAAADVERARAGDVLFFRRTTLPAGRYTLEYVIHDALAGKAGAGREPIDIEPVSADGLEAGSLVIVRQADRLPASERDAANPLQVGELVLTPNIGEPITKGRADRLAFLLRVRPSKRPVSARLGLRRADIAVVSVPIAPPTPDADGRLTYLGVVPLANLTPGPFELRVTVDDGATSLTRAVGFILDP